MSERPIETLPGDEFLRNAERMLTPPLMECFSEETKKVRNIVLILGFVLILLALGVVSAEESKPVELPLIKLTLTVKKGLSGVLITVCSYFLVLLAARSYIEWNL